MSEDHQQFKGIHPEYYAKWLAYERPWYAGRIAAAETPIHPARQPTEPIIRPEEYMRLLQANSRIYPDGKKAVYVPPTEVNAPEAQPTNPEITERLVAYGARGSRPWYADPYVPYVGWPNMYLQTGEQV